MIAFFHRYLDPAESLGEILFGLIMVLTCTLGAGVIGSTDRAEARALLLAAVGCNLAWGVIDAALYVMGNLFVRSHKARLMQAIQAAPDEAAALAIVEQYFESRIEAWGDSRIATGSIATFKEPSSPAPNCDAVKSLPMIFAGRSPSSFWSSAPPCRRPSLSP